MEKPENNFRSLPSVDSLLRNSALELLVKSYGREMAVYAIREVLASLRNETGSGAAMPKHEDIVRQTVSYVESLAGCGVKKVINATGVVLHTNLGRAPLGQTVCNDSTNACEGYCNIEFDLATGKRGNRNTHIAPLLRYLTGAQDAIAVNNNAAALILVLSTLAKNREVIISRGELIEIGGEFRIPDIMRAGQVRMVEVGTTNRTRLSDYENAITPKTALIFKAHKSNYEIRGFTEETSVKSLAALASGRGIPMVYDIGSGLLRRPQGLPLQKEPDVRSSLADGADLVTFSGDKLLGGPQAGIIAGRADLVAKLSKAPLMRALRPGKLILSALSSACRQYFSDDSLKRNNPAFAAMSQNPDVVKDRAGKLKSLLDKNNINCEVVSSRAQPGGGSLPDLVLESYSVSLVPPDNAVKKREQYAQRLFKRLMTGTPPVVAVLREGRLELDCFTMTDSEIETAALVLAHIVSNP